MIVEACYGAISYENGEEESVLALSVTRVTSSDIFLLPHDTLFLKSLHLPPCLSRWLSEAGTFLNIDGGLAQLARALAWHARGHRFDSGILHIID